MESSEQVVFDSDGSSVIVDNSENDHTRSEEYMFTDKIDPIISNGVATIDGKFIIPKDIGTVSWSWNFDEGQLHTKKLNNVFSWHIDPVNILSATILDESMKGDEGTRVITKREYYIFTWYFGKYKNIISHSENCLPELDIKVGFSNFSGFSRGWDQFQDIEHLNFPLPLYTQERIQE